MSSTEDLRRTPLYDLHVRLGARMTAFAGYEMPIQYSGIIEEHRAVRRSSGLFDVSHMGEIFVRGSDALGIVQHLITNDASRLTDGQAMYTVMCREDGGIVDDLLVYRYSEDEYMLVVNAANVSKDLDWIRQHAGNSAEIEDRSQHTALIAIQGPSSHQIVEEAAGLDLVDLKYYHFVGPQRFLGADGVTLSFTGYTGEKGLEIYCRPDDAPAIWSALLRTGGDRVKPCGLAARDTLRIEAGFSLYGNDIDETTDPLEAGLGWLVKLDQGAFIGSGRLREIKADGPARRLIGFVLEERGIPRPGLALTDSSGKRIGEVTSGTQSPVLERGIGLGYVPNESTYTTEGAIIWVEVRGRQLRARVTRPPFHKK